MATRSGPRWWPTSGRSSSREGDNVADGDTLVILESMKMEIPVLAEADGTVAALHVAEGDVVQEGDLIARRRVGPPGGRPAPGPPAPARSLLGELRDLAHPRVTGVGVVVAGIVAVRAVGHLHRAQHDRQRRPRPPG